MSSFQTSPKFYGYYIRTVPDNKGNLKDERPKKIHVFMPYKQPKSRNQPPTCRTEVPMLKRRREPPPTPPAHSPPSPAHFSQEEPEELLSNRLCDISPSAHFTPEEKMERLNVIECLGNSPPTLHSSPYLAHSSPFLVHSPPSPVHSTQEELEKPRYECLGDSLPSPAPELEGLFGENPYVSYPIFPL